MYSSRFFNVMKKKLSYLISSFAILILLIASCTKEPILGSIEAIIDGYGVTFSVYNENVNTYFWDFGDGASSTDASPVHDYDNSGFYTVTLTVDGRGGEAMATKQIQILPSFLEMFTGGLDATSGKTWVLTGAYEEGINGGSVVDSAMVIILPTVDDILTLIGLEEEYDNEFTFYSDGRYKVDVKNGIALTTGIYATVNDIIVDIGNESNTMGIYAATYSQPESATWTLHDEDLVVDVIMNPFGMDVPAPIESRTISGRKWVSISDDAFFGILDFPTTRKFIIKDITPDRMDVALFICLYQYDLDALDVPSYLFHLTYVPKI